MPSSPFAPLVRLLLGMLLLLPACAPPAENAPAADAASEAPEASAATESEYPTPDFRLAVLGEEGEEERTMGPHDFPGKIVIIDFWATWCGPCRLQAEFLEQLHAQLSPDDVQFLALDVGEEADSVRRFTADKPFPYPVLLDPEDTLTGKYDILGLPAVMIVGRDGEVAWMRVGISDLDALRAALSKAGLEVAVPVAPETETSES